MMCARNHYTRFALVLVALATCLTGCQSMKNDSDDKFWKPTLPDSVAEKIPWTEAAKNRPQVPAKLVAMWSDTVKRQAGKQSERGFGGRIVFHGADDEPVRVDGRLVVYAFDETGRDPNNVVPDRKFVFPAETLEKHHSDSKLGPSYSFWIPWDAVGGEQKQISLITRFEVTNGPLIVGEQTKHILPGNQPLVRQAISQGQRPNVSTDNGLTENGPTQNAVQQVSYNATVNAPADSAADAASDSAKRRMKTTTIALPNQFGHHRPTAVRGDRSRRPALPPAAAQAVSPAPAGINQLPASRSPVTPTTATSPNLPSAAPRAVDSQPAQHPVLTTPFSQPLVDRTH